MNDFDCKEFWKGVTLAAVLIAIALLVADCVMWMKGL